MDLTPSFIEYIEQAVEKVFDLTPAAIIRDLDLRKPIYRKLAAYGHMGREDLWRTGIETPSQTIKEPLYSTTM